LLAVFGVLGIVVAVALVKYGGGEANLIVFDFGQVCFVGMNGCTFLQFGFIVCVLGLIFGFVIYGQFKNLFVYKSMWDISELIYEICKMYLII